MKKSRLEAPSQRKERISILRKLNFTLVISVLMMTGAWASVNTPSSAQQMGQNSSTAVQQQKKQITGKVVDSDNLPLPGVGVLVKNSTIGTVTNPDGDFLLEVPENAEVLQFSFVGMKSQEVAISGKTTFKVVLEIDAIGLEEVVAVGYGNQQKKDITGAVSSVKSENFNKGVVSSPEQLLQGKISGVNITSSSGAPGSGQRIIERCSR